MYSFRALGVGPAQPARAARTPWPSKLTGSGRNYFNGRAGAAGSPFDLHTGKAAEPTPTNRVELAIRPT